MINKEKLSPKEMIQYVKESINLEQVIDYSLGINLSVVRGNKTKLILCPFHDDHIPSFAITPKENKFKYFGCDAKGDIVTLFTS